MTQLIEGEICALMMNCDLLLSLAFREGCISKLFEVLFIIHCYFIHLSQHLNLNEETVLMYLHIFCMNSHDYVFRHFLLLLEKVDVRS